MSESRDASLSVVKMPDEGRIAAAAADELGTRDGEKLVVLSLDGSNHQFGFMDSAKIYQHVSLAECCLFFVGCSGN